MSAQVPDVQGKLSWSERTLRSLGEPREADRNTATLLELDQSLANSGVSTQFKLSLAGRIRSDLLDSLASKLFIAVISFLAIAILFGFSSWTPSPVQGLLPLFSLAWVFFGLTGIRCMANALLAWIVMNRIASRMKELQP